jgi:hypothetical protein
MAATILFTIPAPSASEDPATIVVWYDSVDGSDFVQIAEEQVANLPVDDDGVYTWALPEGDTTHYQLVKTRSALGIESFSGFLLPPLPANPTLQSLYGSAKEFGSADWAVDDIVNLTMDNNQLVGDVILEPVTLSTTINANGLFSLTVDKGAGVTLQIKNVTTGKVYFSKSFTVSDDDQKNIKDY